MNKKNIHAGDTIRRIGTDHELSLSVGETGIVKSVGINYVRTQDGRKHSNEYVELIDIIECDGIKTMAYRLRLLQAEKRIERANAFNSSSYLKRVLFAVMGRKL